MRLLSLAPIGWLRATAVLPLIALAARAQLLPPERVPLDSLAAFRPVAANWKLAGDVSGDPRRDKSLSALEGTGVLVCQATAEARSQLFTTWEHGDLEVDLDFLMLPGADSGLYFQGRYELQMRDSWGKAVPTASDNGGILPAWDETKPAAERNTGGSAPKANASRAPGLWQHFHVEFEAPRFDSSGKKVRNARFVRVVLNGFTIQENVECAGATRGGAFQDEAALGPLMIQGNNLLPGHAIRNLAVKRFGNEKITTSNLHYKLYAGNYQGIGAYDAEKPRAEGRLERFTQAEVQKDGRFALTITGELVAPRAGAYRFSAEASGATRLLLDGNPVVVPLERGSQAGIVTLAAGKHEFRLDLAHAGFGRPALDLFAEGPGIAPHALTVRDEGAPSSPQPNTKKAAAAARKGAAPSKKIVVEPTDRVLLQRGFVPFDPRKRLYAASVGSPAGVHYAYDFETGTVLRAWRGSFVDTYAMWDNRGNDQTAVANGPALTFHGKPTIALIENAATGDWPEQPDPLWSSRGYALEPDGTPIFLGKLADIDVRDRIAPNADGRGLTRTIELKGRLPSWSTWVLLAESTSIKPQPAGGWIIGQREWFIDWPAGAAHRPIVRHVNGKQQLAIALTAGNLEKPITYSIVW